MSNLYIIYGKFFDFKTDSITIGGVQTYISNLIEVAAPIFGKVYVLQMGDNSSMKVINGAVIKQFDAETQKIFENKVYNWISKNDNIDDCLVLFATDSVIFQKYRFKKSIAIQHGISWDIPKPDSKKSFKRILLSKTISAYKTICNLEKTEKVICVDYNFQNWFRSLTAKGTERLVVIPNFTEVAPHINKSPETIRIIFARRLFPYRGTRVFTEAIKKVVTEYPFVEVTIAGDGPDESWMRDQLKDLRQVSFTRYSSNESIQIHSDKHIAVVPTVGSEGTSLSLLEAMSAQCAVVCSDVGGMTNVVLDRYNGLIVKAGDAISLYEAIKKLIIDEELRKQIAENAYRTVINSFSREIWKEKWNNVLEHY
jgi:glycosyltransferase involved in cell wall biosynthesis